MKRRPLVAILDRNALLATLLEEALQMEGFETMLPDVDQLRPEALAAAAPDVVVYDVDPPYDTSWRLLQLVRESVPHARLVLTSTDARALEDLGTPGVGITTLLKPYDLRAMTRAVHCALEVPDIQA